MSEPILLRLAGDEGLRLTVADDGEVHDWLDILVPSGDYAVSVSTASGLVSSVQLHGPVLTADLVERSTTHDIPERSVLCIADSRHRQPELGPYLAHDAVAAELVGLFARVVTPAWLGTPVLLVGPTAPAYQDLWSVAWRKGAGEPTKVTLHLMED